MTPVRIELEDVLGTREISADALTIGELLASNGLPETLFQPYLVHAGSTMPIPLSTLISSIPETTDRVVVRAIRNTLFRTILPERGEAAQPEDGIIPGIGFRSLVTGDDDRAAENIVVLDHIQARALVSEQVVTFAQDYRLGERGCVFGVSGGGDSNALAYGLRDALAPERLKAFTIVFGEVFSEAAADRALVLCQDLGIDHTVYRPRELEELLGVTTSLDALYDDFTEIFGTEALHFFGTFLILRTARTLAITHDFADLAFGYNREDLLAELLFMLMNGHRPLAYPVRDIGPHRVVMPAWQAPKLLLDACHPDFSLENYRERDAHTTRQRSLAFFLAHSLDSSYPSFGLSLLTGIEQVLRGAFGELEHDAEADIFLTRQADPESLLKVKSLLARNFDA